jgi:FkbM family methyltransferase
LAPMKGMVEDVIGVRGKKWIKYAALRAKMALGAEPFCNAGGIDRQLLEYVGEGPGFFVEAGGNDGIDSSTTYYYEKALGWSGILVEPIPQLAAFARQVRSCAVHEVALGPPELAGSTVTLNFADGRSSVGGERTEGCKWAGWFGPNPTAVCAPVVTISDLLASAGDPDVSFMTIDVEGYELDVLRGLDLKRHAPRIVVVESFHGGVSKSEGLAHRPLAQIVELLQPRYDFGGIIGHGDALLLRR